MCRFKLAQYIRHVCGMKPPVALSDDPTEEQVKEALDMVEITPSNLAGLDTLIMLGDIMHLLDGREPHDDLAPKLPFDQQQMDKETVEATVRSLFALDHRHVNYLQAIDRPPYIGVD